MPKQSTMVNRPDAADFLELPPGVHKVEWHPDTRFPLCGTFVFHLEDYTLGYIIRNDLLNDPRVKFVGLRQPHPLEAKIELRIQTISVNPFSLLQESLRRRKAALALLKARFKAAAGAAPVIDSTTASGDVFLFPQGQQAEDVSQQLDVDSADKAEHRASDIMMLDPSSLLMETGPGTSFEEQQVGSSLLLT